MDRKYTLIISAVISFSIYILLILSFLLYIKSTHVKKYNSVSKSTVLELDLIVTKEVKQKHKINKQQKNNIVKHKIIKKSMARSAKQKTDLKSLFAHVSIKSKKVEKKAVLNIRKNKVNSRFKSKYEKERKIKQIKVSKLIDIKNKYQIVKKDFSANKGNHDKYYSKINNIILSRWYQYPLFIQTKYLVKVIIIIDTKGVFRYHIIAYSGNNTIDDAVKDFLDKETQSIYPIPPDNKTKEIIINFKPDKEK